MSDIIERLNSFANWHTSCNGGNVSEEAQMCIDAADEIERLRAFLKRDPDVDYSLVDMIGFLGSYESYRD